MSVSEFCTLSALIPFPVQVTTVRRSVSTDITSGYAATRRLQSSHSRNTGRPERRRWRLQLDLHGATEAASVESTFLEAAGVGLPVDWEPPKESQAIPVKFVSNTLRERILGKNRSLMSFEVEEVI